VVPQRPIRPSTQLRALTRLGRRLTRTRNDDLAGGAPGLSGRTLDHLEHHRLVRLGAHVPNLGRPIHVTRAGERALIARGDIVDPWPQLLNQDVYWLGSAGERTLLSAMDPAHRANAAAWMQTNAAAIRRQVSPRLRGDAEAWITKTPLWLAMATPADLHDVGPER
jgi:hypothetical protein